MESTKEGEKILSVYRRTLKSAEHGSNRMARVAEVLEISVGTLYSRIKKLGIGPQIEAMRESAKQGGLVKRKDVGKQHVCAVCKGVGHKSGSSDCEG